MPEPTTPTEAKLDQLIEKSHRILFTAHALFPFQLIPDRVVIDQNKVTVEYRYILHTENIHTLLLQDITSIEVTYVLFLATLVIKGRETCTVPFMRIPEAVKAKQIIAGLLIARRENLNLDEVAPEVLVEKLVEIGKPHAAQ